MNKKLRKKLIKIAQEELSSDNVTHDFQHAYRVLSNAENIAEEEEGDLDIIVPAALFHDLVIYPKGQSNEYKSQKESAEGAERILSKLEEYPEEKIKKVKTCIMECSFNRNLDPSFLESAILQDADGLEATGAISVMRTYSYTGETERPFYDPEDPFCEERKPDATKFALDLFYERLLKVSDRMNTSKAKEIADRRTEFLEEFLEELKLELKGN